MPQPLVVMGVSGCGKSTVGKAIAARLNRPFFDADDFHPPDNVAKMSRGDALTDADRGPWLARLAELLKDEPEAVLACSALKRAYRDRLRAGTRVWFAHLHLDRAALLGRVSSRGAHFMPASLLDSQLETLESPQADETALLLDGTLGLDTLVDQVAAEAASRR